MCSINKLKTNDSLCWAAFLKMGALLENSPTFSIPFERM